ncbi:MAG TPA: ATP-binding cassette domain-containing protein [Candidatus Limnocylindria bacterium]|jgi:ABC-2 type transport system ATP-binding protein|nr:ATP-binding cassette domain-containing protein [Candidatus Limnocylindria bacterium]
MATPSTSIPAGSEASTATPAIRVKALAKAYPGNRKALDGLSFEAAAGTVFALLGPNGAGKSTTIKILTTLIRADAGEAQLLDVDVIRQPQEARRLFGCVAQRSGTDAALSARENLIIQGRLHRIPKLQARERMDELLARFRLTEAADKVVSSFSGGMQRKLDLALGLMHRPKILFLDEPTTGLDPEARAELWRDIGDLARAGTTILLTTHYLEEADRLAARVAIVDKGRVVAEGPPEVLKASLNGDSVHFELEADAVEAAVRQALASVEGSHGLVCDRRSVRIRVTHGASALPRLINALEAAGIKVASATVARPTLDDVYLQFAGRSLRGTNGDSL